MCGIIGFTKKNSGELERGLKLIEHRGPDGEGVFCDEKVSLGHRRLAILDLSDKASQPMVSVDGKTVIIFNGEIYNFQELKNDLTAKGYRFESTGDTEVILHGYKEYGADFFSKMRGMWALAIYDKDKKRLVLARDYFGIKPLIYAVKDGVLYFASELKGVKSMVSGLEPDGNFYFQLFSLGYFWPPQTCYQGVKKLEPGQILVWDLEKKQFISETRAKILEKDAVDYEASLGEAADKLEKALIESVNAHFVSDVPVGILLSGGNDSSLIAALAVAQGKKPVAYNLDIKKSIDSEYAKKVSRHLGLELECLEMTEGRLEKQYEKIWEIIDEPTAESSFIPTSLIYSAIAGKAKVVLSGEGGDELFGGYVRHDNLFRHSIFRKDNIAADIFNSLSGGTSRFSLACLNPAINRLRNLIIENFNNDVVGSYLINTRIADYPYDYKKTRAGLFDLYERLKKEKFLEGEPSSLFFDKYLYLPGDLMYKNDMSSMAYSIEARVPLLDKGIFNTVYRHIKPEYRLSEKYRQKAILKKILEKYLPKDLIYRPKKGFSFSFKRYQFKSFRADFEKAVEFHLKNADIFGSAGSGLDKLLGSGNHNLIVQKYPSLAFALVSNWKIFGK